MCSSVFDHGSRRSVPRATLCMQNIVRFPCSPVAMLARSSCAWKESASWYQTHRACLWPAVAAGPASAATSTMGIGVWRCGATRIVPSFPRIMRAPSVVSKSRAGAQRTLISPDPGRRTATIRRGVLGDSRPGSAQPRRDKTVLLLRPSRLLRYNALSARRINCSMPIPSSGDAAPTLTVTGMIRRPEANGSAATALRRRSATRFARGGLSREETP